MSYSIQKDLDKNLVTATYSAGATFQHRIDLLNELVEIMQDHHDINILIDIRNANENMTPTEQIEYGELIASKQQYFLRNRTAILSHKNKNPHPFIIPTAYVGGYRSICEFDSEIEAVDWLNGEIK